MNDNACREFRIQTKFLETKQVTISIKLPTGCITVKGADHKCWIDNEFILLKKHVINDTNQQRKDEEVPAVVETKEQVPEEEKKKETKSEKKLPTDTELLWEENGKLRVAIRTLEDAVKAKTCTCKSGSDNETLNPGIAEKVQELEKLYDSKLATFTELLEKKFRVELKEAKKVLNNKVSNINIDLSTFKQDCSDEQEGLYYKVKSMEEKVMSDVGERTQAADPNFNRDVRESLATTEIKIDEINTTLKRLQSDPKSFNIQQPNQLYEQVQEIKTNLSKHIANMDAFRDMFVRNMNQQNLQPIPTYTGQHMPRTSPMPSSRMATYPIYPEQSKLPTHLTFPRPLNQSFGNSQKQTMNSNNPLMSGQSYNRMAHPVPYTNPDLNVVCPDMNTEYVQTIETEDTSNKDQTNSNTLANGNNSSIPSDSDTELLILIDSNSNHINRRQFWTLDRTKWLRCGTVNEAMRGINGTNYRNLKYLLLSVGVNDTDDEEGQSVAGKISEIVDAVHYKYPEVKIILNELTPRMDERDGEVTKCNKALASIAVQDDLVFLAKQGNLRDNSFFRDNKHIKSEKIGRYVANVKNELRNAYGIKDPRKSNHSANFERISPRLPQRQHDQNNFHNNKLAHYQNQMRGSADDELKVNLRRLFALLQ